MDRRRAEASAWHSEMFDPDAEASPPTRERQDEFEAWLLDAANREALASIAHSWKLLGTLLNLPAPKARELIGDDYEPALYCLDGGKE